MAFAQQKESEGREMAIEEGQELHWEELRDDVAVGRII